MIEIRNKNMIWGLFLLIITLFSCSDFEKENKSEASVVNFYARLEGLGTRATENAWEGGDKVGIYVMNREEGLSENAIYNRKKNVKHIVSDASQGILVSEDATEKVFFPEDGKYLDFIAYYPYSDSITRDYKYLINVEKQTPLSSIDLLYAVGTGNRMYPNVSLAFSHVLARVTLSLEGSELENSLEGVAVSVNNALTQANFSLVDGSIVLGAERKKIESVVKFSTQNKAMISLILIPGQKTEELSFEIKLFDGTVYKWNLSAGVLKKGQNSIYSLSLKNSDISLNLDNAIIHDWQNKGVVSDTIQPVDSDKKDTVEKGGNGTESSPYTVQQSIEKQGEEGVWISGYIVGYAKGSSSFVYENNATKDTNILVADNVNHTGNANVLVVQLPKGELRTHLNLMTNPLLLGKKVFLKGDLMEYYGASGMRNTGAYIFP